MLKLTFVIAVLFSMICFSQDKDSRKFLTYCTEVGPQTLNPQKASDANTFLVTHSLYSRLVEFKRGETNIEPGLAVSWKISPDLLTYTFKLRKNVSFHGNSFFTPKRNLNADDVVFSFQRMLNKDHPFHGIGFGDYDYFLAMDLQEYIKDVRKVNEDTVEFVMHQPDAAFLSTLAMDFASILSQEYADEMVKSKKLQFMDEYPIGTGPFRLESFAKDKRVVLAKFDKYWKKNIYLDSINFDVVPDVESRQSRLLDGTCDMVGSLRYNMLQDFKRNPKFQVQEKPGLNTLYLALNTQKKPFDNLRVRQAISMTLNRKKYIEDIFKNQAMLAKNIIPPFILGYNEQVKDFNYNPKLAEKIFKEEGVIADGTTPELELWVLPVSRAYLQESQKLAEAMREDFLKVGIQLKLVTMDWSLYLSKSKKGEHFMALFGWVGDNGDPDNFFNILLSCHGVEAGSNRSRWCSKELDDLIEGAKRTDTRKVRSDLYRRAQLVIRDAVPIVPLAHAKIFRVLRKTIQNYKIDPLGGESFEGVQVKN